MVSVNLQTRYWGQSPKFMWLSPKKNSEHWGSVSFPALPHSSYVVTHPCWRSSTAHDSPGRGHGSSVFTAFPDLPYAPRPLADFNLHPFPVRNPWWAWQLSVSCNCTRVHRVLWSPSANCQSWGWFWESLNVQLVPEVKVVVCIAHPLLLLYYLNSTRAWGPSSRVPSSPMLP